jgi:predicted GH43/DUF377 family glycosyl hydrolase
MLRPGRQTMTRTIPALALCMLATASALAAARSAPGAPFSKRSQAVFRGQFGLAGDPSVVKDAASFRMCYTCPDPERKRVAICLATSRTGTIWRAATGFGDTRAKGLVLRGADGTWNENVETCDLVRDADGDLLYYAGYQQQNADGMGLSAALGVARAAGNGTFVPVGAAPVLEPTPGWYDHDALFSPTVVRDQGTWSMVYAGHCYSDCPAGTGVFLLGATSADGLSWQKLPAPVLAPLPGYPWMHDGVAEPALLRGDDGAYYLFFTGLHDDERVIGAARGPSPFGPWDVSPLPFVVPTFFFERSGVLAPSVLLDGGTVRMWYLGTRPARRGLRYAIGYATARWPLPWVARIH